MCKTFAIVWVVSCVVLTCSSQMLAAVRLPLLFSNNMVLQRDAKVPVWGWAQSGEKVSVSVAGRAAEAVADEHGRWRAVLDPMPAGGPFEMTVQGTDTLVFKNVMVGEVWICGGQSNMGLEVTATLNAKDEIRSADYPEIRLLQVPWTRSDEPLDNIDAKWAVCSPTSIPKFGGTPYYFGRQLYKDLKVPVGLIHCSVGGVVLDGFLSKAGYAACPELAPVVGRWQEAFDEFDKTPAGQEYDAVRQQWLKDVADARANGKPVPTQPAAKNSPRGRFNRPSCLYNGMIAPLIPYAMRGAIFYHGESNQPRAVQYRTMFPALIADWRKSWGQGEFPFFFVQLANLDAAQTRPVEPDDLPELREAQLMSLKVPNTAMVSAVDVGEAGDVHFRNKQEVGRRLALVAEARVYGKQMEYMGPIFQSFTVEGDKVRVKFAHVGGALAAMDRVELPPAPKRAASSSSSSTSSSAPATDATTQALIPPHPQLFPAKELKGFAIAGEDKKFVWANARIEGDSVVVWSEQVPNPASVRYGWAPNPIGNLYNIERLPASPFRTDDWPGITDKKVAPRFD